MSKNRDKGKRNSVLITGVTLSVLLLCVLVGISSAVLQASKSESDTLSENVDTPDILVITEPPTPDVPETHDVPDIQETFDEPHISSFIVHSYDKIPKSHKLKVTHITQYDKLITGCEIVCTKTVLDYYGIKGVSLKTLTNAIESDKLRMSSDGRLYGKSPSQAFIGDPTRIDGFGCFPSVICDLVDDLELEGYYTEDTTGMSLGDLCSTYIIQDVPVLIWVTDSMVPVVDGDSWYLTDENGKISSKRFVWPLNEHCVVLTGYDKNNYYISDPLSWSETSSYPKAAVDERFTALGRMSAVVWQDKNTEE